MALTQGSIKRDSWGSQVVNSYGCWALGWVNRGHHRPIQPFCL